MDPLTVLRDLTTAVKAAVAPLVGARGSRDVTGVAASGDSTFRLDLAAEAAVERFLSGTGLPVAYYTEDRGLIPPETGATPEAILIIDPVDGTRGAVTGFEACVVSAAWAPYKPAPVMADVRYAVVTEIKTHLTLCAERGAGVQLYSGAGIPVPLSPLACDSAAAMPWAVDLVGAPVDLIFRVLGPVASASTLEGGLFVLNSSAFELTRLATGQLAAVVDIRNRLLREYPPARPAFLQHGRGRLVCLYPYDVAAAALIVQEAGGVVTDAWGRSLDDWKLLDTSEPNFGSLIAASNGRLHAQLLKAVDAAFAELSACGP